MLRPPPISTLFLYTTLFRSRSSWPGHRATHPSPERRGAGSFERMRSTRSEEHTSELQSRVDLVCRLLLEKKKKHKISKNSTHTPTITNKCTHASCSTLVQQY